MATTKDPTFEDGPFFYISEPLIGQPSRNFIVWATDAYTARSVFGVKTNYSIAYIYPELVGSLSDLKRDYRLTPTQIVDLHREGYLRL
jgi:hypothetical protein